MVPDPDSGARGLIHAVNMEETYRRRLVRGRDFNDWHPQLEQWWAAQDYAAILGLLSEIITAAEALQQYDDREPQAYWYVQAAKAHAHLGDHAAAVSVLERWFRYWPTERIRFDRAPQRMQRLLDAARTATTENPETLF